MKKLILFDIDGTLITRCLVHEASFSAGFQKVFGVDATVNEIHAVGKTDKRIAIEVLKNRGFTEKQIILKIDQVFDEMTTYCRDNIAFDDSFEAIPHVKGLLVELVNRGHFLGLVTGNVERIAKMKLRKVGLSDFFKVGAFGDSSEIRSQLVISAINNAKEELKIRFDGKDVFIVGDTPLDIEGGKQAGVKTIAVSTGSYKISELRRHNPDHLFTDFSDISSIIKVIEKIH